MEAADQPVSPIFGTHRASFHRFRLELGGGPAQDELSEPRTIRQVGNKIRYQSIIALIISILMAQVAGLIGSLFTVSSINTWYVTLAKPGWNPPSWVFGPVWTVLYTLIGAAAYLVWRNKDAAGAKIALAIYAGHLVLNTLWSIIFFGLQNPGLALAEILLLLASILTTSVLFSRVNKWSGILFLPYIGWVAFATALNYAIWQLN